MASRAPPKYGTYQRLYEHGRGAPKSALQQRAYDLISYRDPDDGLPTGVCSRELGQVCWLEAEVRDDHGGFQMRRHVMLWMKTRTALIFCVSAGKGEGGDVVRAWASVLFVHASEWSLCWRWQGALVLGQA